MRDTCHCSTTSPNNIPNGDVLHVNILGTYNPKATSADDSNSDKPSQQPKAFSGSANTTIFSSPNLPNPSLENLGHLDTAISFYDHLLPLLSLDRRDPYDESNPSDFALDIEPLSNDSLNLNEPWLDQYYHCFLNDTQLHYNEKSDTRRTVPLGRILYQKKQTYWVVVVEIDTGRLLALRASDIAIEQWWSVDDGVLDVWDQQLIDPVEIPIFKRWKAVDLGNTSILDIQNASDIQMGGWKALEEVTDWDSRFVRK